MKQPKYKELYEQALLLMESQANEILKDDNARAYGLWLHEVVALGFYLVDLPETSLGIETIFNVGFYRGMEYQKQMNHLKG